MNLTAQRWIFIAASTGADWPSNGLKGNRIKLSFVGLHHSFHHYLLLICVFRKSTNSSLTRRANLRI